MNTKKHRARSIGLVVLLAGAALLMGAGMSYADEGPAPTTMPAAQTQAEPTTRPAHRFVRFAYTPPADLGVPVERDGGAGRGPGGDGTYVAVLAPAHHAGLTAQAQPTLVWYLSKPTDLPVVIALTRGDDAEPAFELTISGHKAAGCHLLDLSKQADDQGRHLSLEQGSMYHWVVAVRPDPANRSADVLAGAYLKRTIAEPMKLADVYSRSAMEAQSGLWYDAVGDLSTLIASDQGNTDLRAQRAALLQGQDGKDQNAPGSLTAVWRNDLSQQKD